MEMYPQETGLWSVLIPPITEELFFRGLMYNGFLFVGRKLRSKRAFETFVMLFVASVFAVAPTLAQEFI